MVIYLNCYWYKKWSWYISFPLDLTVNSTVSIAVDLCVTFKNKCELFTPMLIPKSEKLTHTHTKEERYALWIEVCLSHKNNLHIWQQLAAGSTSPYLFKTQKITLLQVGYVCLPCLRVLVYSCICACALPFMYAHSSMWICPCLH